MQITSKFTIAVHIITAIEYFGESETVTSNFLAGSVGANPVIVRGVMSGITLAKDLSDITFYDVYRAVDPIDEEGLFHFHENPNMNCPVGRNIHLAMDDKLREIQTGMEDQMKKITIADVAAEIHKAEK